MNPYLALAKKAVENYIEKGEIIEVPKDLPKEMLTKKASWRFCINLSIDS
jgi:AMMECR1 domain-containing protein